MRVWAIYWQKKEADFHFLMHNPFFIIISKVCKTFKDVQHKNFKFVILRVTVSHRVTSARVESQKCAASHSLQNRVSIACSPSWKGWALYIIWTIIIKKKTRYEELRRIPYLNMTLVLLLSLRLSLVVLTLSTEP